MRNNAEHPAPVQRSLFDLKNDYFDIFLAILTPDRTIRECIFHNPDLVSMTGGPANIPTDLEVMMIVEFLNCCLKNVSTVTLNLVKGMLLEARFKGVSEEVLQGFFREFRFRMASRFPEMSFDRRMNELDLGTRAELNGE